MGVSVSYIQLPRRFVQVTTGQLWLNFFCWVRCLRTSYLNAALEGGDIQVFLLALQNVIKARGGIAEIAKKTKKSRTSLYKSLSEEGNPYLKNTSDILTALDMHLTVMLIKKQGAKRPNYRIRL